MLNCFLPALWPLQILQKYLLLFYGKHPVLNAFSFQSYSAKLWHNSDVIVVSLSSLIGIILGIFPSFSCSV